MQTQVTSFSFQNLFDTLISVGHYAVMLAVLYFLYQRRNAEAKIEMECRELAEKLQKISQQVPGVIYQFRLNPDGSSCFPYASDAIKEIYGVTPQEVQHSADKAFAALYFEDLERVSSSILESAKNLTPWLEEYRVKFDDGTIRWLHGNALPQREADGSTLWHGFITDITDRKNIEIDYKSVVDTSFNGFLSVDFSGKILSVNHSFCEMLGYSESELLKMNISEIELIDKIEEILARIHKILHTGQDHFESKYRHQSGAVLDVRISTVFLQTLGQRIFLFVNNITKQKELEKQLQNSEIRLQAIIDLMPISVFVKDKYSRITLMNKACEMQCGISFEELKNKTGADFYPPEQMAVFLEADKKVFESREVIEVIATLQC